MREQGVGSTTARPFVFYNEGHTPGNPMRTIIMQQYSIKLQFHRFREGVAFCGYSVPNQVQPKMHLRIQTKGRC